MYVSVSYSTQGDIDELLPALRLIAAQGVANNLR
jgi:hypothetical protein